MAKKRVRLIDIADKAGVSRMAVSHVLLGTAKGRISVSEDKAKVIRKIANDLGYVPNRAAQMMHGSKSKTIGVMLDSYGLSSWPSILMLESLAHRAHDAGYQLLTAFTRFREDRQLAAVQDFQARAVDGVICLCTDPAANWLGYGDLLDPFERVVYLGRPPVEKECVSVEFDFGAVSGDAVDHLLRKGCQRLALFLNDDNYVSSLRRRDGFEEEIRRNDVETSRVIIEDCIHISPTLKKTMQARLFELSDAGIDGILAHNDRHASFLISLCHELGFEVPGQFRIVGFDNEPFGKTTYPSLSTVDMCASIQAETALNTLVRWIEGKSVDPITTVSPILVVRGSSA